MVFSEVECDEVEDKKGSETSMKGFVMTVFIQLTTDV